MKIVFMGTPDFAVPSLRELNKKFNVAAVFTQPDRPKGRGHKVQQSSVKIFAVENNIPVYQPEKLKKDDEAIKAIREIKPDVIVVAAYGQILPKAVLEIPKMGCINIHASLLPKLRGAAPINWSIINGDKSTGITVMQMAEGLDTGDMLIKKEIKIGEDETAGELHDRLMDIGASLIIEAFDKIEKNEIVPVKQDDEQSSYAPMLTKDLGHINWDKNKDIIYNLIRGVTPFPGAYTYYNDKIIKIWKCQVISEKFNGEPGEIIDVNKNGIMVKTNDGAININEVQEVGGKRMSVEAYLNGHVIGKGDKLR